MLSRQLFRAAVTHNQRTSSAVANGTAEVRRPLLELGGLVRDTNARVQRLQVLQKPQPITAKSPSTVVSLVENDGKLVIETFAPVAGCPALVSLPVAFTSQAQFVACLTEPLQKLARSSGNATFVNTERHMWIPAVTSDDYSHKYIPHGLVTHSALYETSKDAVHKKRHYTKESSEGSQFLFGRGVWELRDLYAGIVMINPRGGKRNRGKLYACLQRLSVGDDVNTYRGVLIGKKHFTAVECCNTNITKAVRGALIDGGSFQFLSSFLAHRSRCCKLLDELCSKLEVDLERQPGRPANKGSSRYGHRFAVCERSGERRLLALKCVLLNTLGASPLLTFGEAEFSTMSINAPITPGMMSVVPGSLIAATESVNDEVQTLGFGFLQEHVGQPLPADRAHHELAAKTLAMFHARTPPLYHGDAQAANVVLVAPGRVVWLDWMYSHSLVHGRVDDIKNFVESTRGTNVWERVPAARKLLERYGRAQACELETIAAEIVSLLFEKDQSGIKINSETIKVGWRM
jgi:hypothetical protein